jgi:hypothetical protein
MAQAVECRRPHKPILSLKQSTENLAASLNNSVGIDAATGEARVKRVDMTVRFRLRPIPEPLFVQLFQSGPLDECNAAYTTINKHSARLNLPTGAQQPWLCVGYRV